MSRILDKLKQLQGVLPDAESSTPSSTPAPTPVLRSKHDSAHRHSAAAVLRWLVGNSRIGKLGALVAVVAFAGGILLVSVTVLLVPPPRANGRLPASVSTPDGNTAAPQASAPQAQANIQIQPPAPRPETEQSVLGQARTWIAEGRADAAVALLERSTGQNPKWTEALLLLSLEYRKQGRLDRSGGALVRALQVNPDNALAYNNLGMIQMRNRKPREAIPYFERAFKLDQKSPQLMLNLAIAYEQVEAWGRAAESYERYLQLTNPENKPSRDRLVHAARFRMHRLRAWARASGEAEASRALAGEESPADADFESDPDSEDEP